MKMRLMMTAILVLGGAAMMSAQQKERVKKETAQTEQVQQRKGPRFVDENKNGVCDNYENGTSPRQMGEGYNQGYERGYGQGYRQGMRDGMRQGGRNAMRPRMNQRMNQDSSARPQGEFGPRRGMKGQFVDKNQNGICDYYEELQQQTPAKAEGTN